jgi:hypothetical protein
MPDAFGVSFIPGCLFHFEYLLQFASTHHSAGVVTLRPTSNVGLRGHVRSNQANNTHSKHTRLYVCIISTE